MKSQWQVSAAISFEKLHDDKFDTSKVLVAIPIGAFASSFDHALQ